MAFIKILAVLMFVHATASMHVSSSAHSSAGAGGGYAYSSSSSGPTIQNYAVRMPALLQAMFGPLFPFLQPVQPNLYHYPTVTNPTPFPIYDDDYAYTNPVTPPMTAEGMMQAKPAKGQQMATMASRFVSDKGMTIATNDNGDVQIVKDNEHSPDITKPFNTAINPNSHQFSTSMSSHSSSTMRNGVVETMASSQRSISEDGKLRAENTYLSQIDNLFEQEQQKKDSSVKKSEATPDDKKKAKKNCDNDV